MSAANIAIIGSNGFIGKHLTARLLKYRDCNLHLFGRSEYSAIDKELNYKQFDLLNNEQNKIYFKDIDIVYYLASETIPATSWANPLVDVNKNLVPFLTFAECLSGLSIKKIVYLSSAGTVYGTTYSKVNEDANKNPFSPYGIIKLAIENFLLYYKTKYNINYDIYRISNVYGPGQDTSKGLGLINTFLEKIVADNKIKIFGDGNNLRNYIYVKDAAELLSFSATNNISSSGIYNLSSDDTLTINEIVSLIKSIIPQKFEVISENHRQGDNAAIDLDNTKIKNIFPAFKFTSVNAGIEETYNFIKQAHK